MRSPSTTSSASAPSRGTACATTRRATSCATACRSATACCSTTPTARCPGIAGLATVASAAYPDSTQFDPKSHYYDPKATREKPRWFLVDVAFERKLKRLIPLEEIKQHADALGEGFALTAKGSRLSVFPVTAAQWKLLLSLE